MVARIHTLTGAVTGPTRELSFQARVQQLGDASWSLTLLRRVAGEQHARILRGESCEAVAEAASVIVALALREAPTTEAGQQQPSSANEPTRTRRSQPPAARAARRTGVAVRQPADPTSAASSPSSLRLEAGEDISTFRNPVTLLSFTARGALSGAFGLELVTMSLWPRTVVRVDEQGGVEANVFLATQGLRGCFGLAGRVLVSSGCAVTEAGILRAKRDESGYAFWWAAGLRLGLEARIDGPLYVGVAVEGLVPLFQPLLRSRRSVEPTATLWTTWPSEAGLGSDSRFRDG